jgi:hypothetical protein
MSLGPFIASLFQDGCVRVPTRIELTGPEISEADLILLRVEREYRQHLPHVPPELDRDAARHGATLLYHGCQLLTLQEGNRQQIVAGLRAEFSGELTPAAHYSVDLALRFLPDLYAMARLHEQDSTVVAELQRVAALWPLSSVGMWVEVERSRCRFIQDRCLLQLYVDRVIERRDLPRLDDPVVANLAAQALGAFPQLAPEVAAKLDLNHQHEALGLLLTELP